MGLVCLDTKKYEKMRVKANKKELENKWKTEKRYKNKTIKLGFPESG
jgi:hypothetical protein